MSTVWQSVVSYFTSKAGEDQSLKADEVASTVQEYADLSSDANSKDITKMVNHYCKHSILRYVVQLVQMIL
jgi:hypothetical protein